MKNIVAETMMDSLAGLSKDALDLQESHREFQRIQCYIQLQNACLIRIEKHISCLPKTELSGSNAKDPTPID